MKNLFLPLALMVVVSCGRDDDKNSVSTDLLDGTWRLAKTELAYSTGTYNQVTDYTNRKCGMNTYDFNTTNKIVIRTTYTYNAADPITPCSSDQAQSAYTISSNTIDFLGTIYTIEKQTSGSMVLNQSLTDRDNDEKPESFKLYLIK
ncbi:hypothetical protein [Daejeonia sp. YH14]|uniref:hypothetical protein n=1 Tax=Daejeonia sp. YH14 TaxID=3439042 RepID=UPI003F493423